MGSKKDPKMKVPTIYKAYFSGLCKGISLQNKAKHIVQYLHSRILKFPLIINGLVVDGLRQLGWFSIPNCFWKVIQISMVPNHQSGLIPMKSPFSYGFPMGFPMVLGFNYK